MTKPQLTTIQQILPVFIQQYEHYLPTAFDENMTLLQKVNKVIKSLQDIYSVSNDLIVKWNEVMTWVLGEGLNDSISTRLDAMIQDGTFANIIDQQLLAEKPNLYVSKTTPSKNTTNTFWLKDDGEKNVQVSQGTGTDWVNLYPITKSKNVVNDAGETMEKVVTESAYIDNVTSETLYDAATKTTYYLTTMPYRDSKGNINQIKRGFAKDNPNSGLMETARSFATRKNASLVINASIFDVSNNKFQGMQIQDGNVLNTLPTRVDRHILGIMDDGTLKSYISTTASSTIIADGCKTALTGFLPLIQNGAKVAQSIFDSYEATTWAYRRQVLAQMPNKDYLILSCESDTLGNVGFNLDDCVRILLSKGVQFAFMLDGGGSEQTVVRGTNLVSLKDDAGKTERGVPDFLYWAKSSSSDRDKAIALASSDAGDVNHRLKKLEVDVYDKAEMNKGYIQLKGASDYTTQGIEIWKGDIKQYKLSINETAFGLFDYTQGKYLFQVGLTSGDIITSAGAISNVNQYAMVANDLNFITKSGWVWGTGATLNTPDSAYSWAIQTIALNSTACIQKATRFTSPFLTMTRRLNGSTWSAWE
jgi:exopolysaccharide biosynthesis protein